MSKLTLFNGGLDIRKSAKLIQSNETVEIENVDTSEGSLKAAKGRTATTTNITNTNKPFYYEGNSEWMNVTGALDYIEYQDKLYYTTASGAKKYDGTNTRNLGIAAPAAAPTCSSVSYSLFSSGATNVKIEYTFTVEKTTQNLAGSGASDGTYIFYAVVSVAGVVYKVINKTQKINTASTYDFDLEASSSDPNVSLHVYTNGDYTSFTHNNSNATVSNSIVSLPTVSTDLIKEGEVVDIGISVYNALNGALSYPKEYSVMMGQDCYIMLSGSHKQSAPASYPNSIVFYIKNNGTFYTIDSSVTTYDALGPPASANSVLIAKVTLGSTYSPTKLNGIYQYVYTYYNNNDGTESIPSPLSSEVAPKGQSVALSVLTASTDAQVTHKRIYRVGGTFTNFILVGSVTNATTTYTDTTADADLTGSVLDSQYNGVPPATLRYIREVYGVFVGAVGSKLYFTRDIGNPNYWPATNYIEFHADITGIGVIGNNFIVFTKYKAFAIQGSSAATFVKYPIRGDQGCLNHDTIADMDGQLLFVSTDGICVTTGSNIQVLSKNKLGKISLSTVNAAVIDEAYYLQLTDGRLLVFDNRYEPNFKYFDTDTDYVITALDVLYGRDDGGTLLYTLFTNATTLSYTYKTGEITEGAVSNQKTYNNIYVHSEGTATMYIYINGVLVATRSIIAGLNDIKVPVDRQRGYYIQFKLTGTGTINEIEYKPVGRTTGD